MKKTKIICTIGPASENIEVLRQMAKNGMDVARLNMSHGDHTEHQIKIDRIRQVSQELDTPIAILIDTKGPEVRVKNFKNGKIELSKGDIFSFVTYDCEGDNEKVTISYKNLPNDVKEKTKILVNDGLLEFEVISITDDTIKCKCLIGGVISDKKGMNFPNTNLSIPYVSQADLNDIMFAIKNDAEFIAASFVGCADNVKEIREILAKNNASNIDIISKIENHAGIDNIDSIIEVSDGIMVARGDMGVEMPLYKLPALQKKLLEKSREKGKRVIVATEMLESMIENQRPTRAEASDVANAVYEGATCVMLSAETTIGKHVVKTVNTMAKILDETEDNIDFEKRFNAMTLNKPSIAEAISHSACTIAYDIKAKLIIVFTTSGYTARMISRFRPKAEIIAATSDKKVYQKLAMNWGVTPMLAQKYDTVDELFDVACQIANKSSGVSNGDKIVIVAGTPVQEIGQTNTIKVIEVKK